MLIIIINLNLIKACILTFILEVTLKTIQIEFFLGIMNERAILRARGLCPFMEAYVFGLQYRLENLWVHSKR